MAKLTRKNIKVFGSNSSNTGEFGSAAAGSGVLTTDIEDMQSLAAWKNGMTAATIGGNKLLPQEEMEAMIRVPTYGIANIYQDGIPVYNANTVYYTNCIARQDNTTNLYKSLTDDNTGNLLTDTVNWESIGDLSDLAKFANISTNEPGYVPYSANYGYTSSGYAAYINKVSNTSVSFLVDDGTTYKPLILTFPNGKTYCITSIATISGLSTGTITYDFILLESNLVATGSTLTIGGITYLTYTATATAVDTTTYDILEQLTEPSASTYSYYLNIATKPYIPYHSVSSAWVETQYIKLGRAVITSSVMGTPVSYAFNGKFYVTSSTVVINTTYTFNHNIGTDNIKVELWIANDTYGWTQRKTDISGSIYGQTLGDILKNTLVFRTHNDLNFIAPNAETQVTMSKYKIIAERNF